RRVGVRVVVRADVPDDQPAVPVDGKVHQAERPVDGLEHQPARDHGGEREHAGPDQPGPRGTSGAWGLAGDGMHTVTISARAAAPGPSGARGGTAGHLRHCRPGAPKAVRPAPKAVRPAPRAGPVGHTGWMLTLTVPVVTGPVVLGPALMRPALTRAVPAGRCAR